jgi:hypothetical protein
MNEKLYLETKIKLKTNVNPYREGESTWNCFLDIQISCDGGNKEVILYELMQEHKMKKDYYETYLPELIEDELVELDNSHF